MGFVALTATPREADARSVYLFTELDNGIGIASEDAYGEVGYTLRGAVGVGGYLGFLPFRLYGVFGLQWSHFEHLHKGDFHRAFLFQNFFGVTLALRADFALFRRMRMMIDVGGGYRWSFSAAEIDGRELYEQEDGEFLPVIGVALRYRVLRMLSIGLRSEWLLLMDRDSPDIPVLAAGLESKKGRRWQANVLLTATVHF